MIAVPPSIVRDLVDQMRRARLIHSTTIAATAPKVTLIPQLFIWGRILEVSAASSPDEDELR
jgi:hypothetical protein